VHLYEEFVKVTIRGTKLPVWLHYVIYNVVMLACLAFTGRLQSDWASIVGVVGGLAMMNFVAWVSD
jgi:hypothetical protein